VGRCRTPGTQRSGRSVRSPDYVEIVMDYDDLTMAKKIEERVQEGQRPAFEPEPLWPTFAFIMALIGGVGLSMIILSEVLL
jgi:hypothetical protein